MAVGRPKAWFLLELEVELCELNFCITSIQAHDLLVGWGHQHWLKPRSQFSVPDGEDPFQGQILKEDQAKVLTRYLIGHQSYRFFLLISWLYAPSPQASLGCVCVSSVASVVSDTLQIPTDYSLLGSSVHGILQARILEWVAMPSSRGSSQPRVQTSNSCVSCTAGRFFTTEPPRKPQSSLTAPLKYCVYCFFCL